MINYILMLQLKPALNHLFSQKKKATAVRLYIPNNSIRLPKSGHIHIFIWLFSPTHMHIDTTHTHLSLLNDGIFPQDENVFLFIKYLLAFFDVLILYHFIWPTWVIYLTPHWVSPPPTILSNNMNNGGFMFTNPTYKHLKVILAGVHRTK